MQQDGYGSQLVHFTQQVADSYRKAQELLGTSAANINRSGHIPERAWQKFLEDWLPPEYQILTRRFISGNSASHLRETDLIVLRPGLHKKYSGTEEVQACDVAAAFEVKLTLNDSHIPRAAAAAARNTRLATPLSGPAKKAADHARIRESHVGPAISEVVGPIIFGLLAHSYTTEIKSMTPFDNLTTRIEKADFSEARRPSESLDLLCVADMGSWIHYAHFMTPPSTNVPPGFLTPRWHPNQVETGYFPYKPVPEIPAVVAFLVSLMLQMNLADPHPMVKSIGDELLKLKHTLSSGSIRSWPAKEFLSPSALMGAIGVNQPFVIK